MKLGILGGSFDPIHNGHLVLADCCREQAELDEILFIPTAVQPLKPTGPVASNEHRRQMIELAIASKPMYRLCTIEFDRGGKSYSIDTLRLIREEKPQADLFFLMGADSLYDLPQWHEPGELLKLAKLLVVRRAGAPAPDYSVVETFLPADQDSTVRWQEISMPATDISSTEIRRRVDAGESIDNLTPAAVVKYILKEQLYHETI